MLYSKLGILGRSLIAAMSNSLDQCIKAVQDAESAAGLARAVAALATLKDPGSIPSLIEVLGFNNPGAAVAAVEGLIQIGLPAVPYLLEKLDGYNYSARAWAIRALAGIGDPRGQDLLLEAAAADFALSVRRAAARGLGFIRWHDISGELERVDRQMQSQTVLLKVTQDEEWVVRYAAIVGLQGLAENFMTSGSQATPLAPITACLTRIITTDDTLAVQARAKWALQTIQNGSESPA
jgi:phycocyanobilin lyase beta subunit